ncbi:MAG: sigma-70 family RNA polymerase sigma factor [Actinomycetota bacterium]|nr:sigma-70 family RNA polymerase sigma factor [Actinomycetota bacterium]
MTSTTLRPDPARTTQEDTAENAATERLFAEHSQRLLAYCSRQLGSHAEAEDAMQTTFLYALGALQRGVVPECEAAWLTTIAKNVCQWHRRTRDRRGPLASSVDLDTIGCAQPEGDEDGVLVGLKDALASIPENQRHALVLREWRGVPPREIAAQLGMSRPATHALLTRARRSLADALTVARRPVLGFAWLAIELRSHAKAFLGGISAKAAVATVAVVGVGVGVGGLAVETSLGRSKAPPAPPAPVQAADEPSVEELTKTSRARAVRPSSLTPGAASADATASRTEDEPSVAPAVDLGIVPTVSLPGVGEPERTGEPTGDVSPPALPVDLPAIPQLPTVELPPDLLPIVEVPPLAPIGLPADIPLPVDVLPLAPGEPPAVPPVPLPTEDLPLSAPPLP